MGRVLRRCRGDLLCGRAAQSANLEVISVWGYLVQPCSVAATLPPVQRPSPAQPSLERPPSVGEIELMCQLFHGGRDIVTVDGAQ